MPVVTMYTPWRKLSLDEDVVACETITQVEALAVSLDLPVKDLHEVVTERSGDAAGTVGAFVFVDEGHRWTVTTGKMSPDAWRAADVDARMNELVRRTHSAMTGTSLLELAAKQSERLARFTDRGFPREPDSMALTRLTSEYQVRVADLTVMLQFWWAHETAAGLDEASARMLVALSGHPALMLHAPEILHW